MQRLLLSWDLVSREKELLNPFDPTAPTQDFTIDLGESTYQVTRRLEEQGLIGDADLLRTFLIYSGLDTNIQAGEYELSARMTPVEIAQALQDATPHEVDFRILPGWRLEEIAAALPTSGLAFSPGAFLSYTRRPTSIRFDNIALPVGASLEGFMHPGGYRLPREISIQAFAEIALQRFESVVDQNLRVGFDAQNLDLFAAVTLASLVQREAVAAEEMPLIASVFINRLAAGMRLDSDPTVQYALGSLTEGKPWWKSPLGLDDLQIDSPYNTYRIAGLPPGPIANPSLSALQAVAFPAQTPYYYFRAACDQSGRHLFAETFEQHQQNACP